MRSLECNGSSFLTGHVSLCMIHCPASHSEDVTLSYFQIIHGPGPKYHLPSCHYPHPSIRPQEVHAQLDLTHQHEAVLHSEKRELLVSIHNLARLCGGFAMFSLRRGSNSQVHQVMVDPVVQDGLRLHLARLGVVGQDSLTYS